MAVSPAAQHSNQDAILQPAGRCINCQMRIEPRAGALRCSTCAAWRRWWSAHRIASQALQEATR